MFFGQNRLFMINTSRDFVYSFSPLDALQFCLYEHQKGLFLAEVLKLEESAPPEFADDGFTINQRLLNSITLRPAQIEVKGSDIWKVKDMSKVQDLKTIEKTFDWTFSTPYKGTL
jgi:TIP41-like family